MQGRYGTSCNATTRSRKRRRPAPQELNGVGLAVPSHMHSEDLQPSLWGDLGISTRVARVKLPAHFNQALDIHAPAMVAHATAQYFPPSTGNSDKRRFRPTHATATAGHDIPADVGFLHRNFFAAAVGTG